MRYIFQMLPVAVMFSFACTHKPAEIRPSGAKQTPAIVTPDAAPTKPRTDTSFQPVKSLLSRTCAPCHNPGGKMYDRLPFDQEEVVRSHKHGILRRLSAEDQAVLEAWLANPKM